MNAFSPIDFGSLVPGFSSLSASGTTVATGTILTRQVNVFSSVSTGAVAVLPSSYASGSAILTMNRGLNLLSIAPAPGDKIENNGLDVQFALPPGWNANLVSFDPPAALSPRTWWILSFVNISTDLGANLFNDGGFLVTTDANYPTAPDGLPVGSLWSNGGLVTVIPTPVPDPGAPAVYFGFVSSSQLLAIEGGNLPLSNPGAGTLQLWNNGGVVCVA